jgi:hypothetical protein
MWGCHDGIDQVLSFLGCYAMSQRTIRSNTQQKIPEASSLQNILVHGIISLY